MKLHKLLLRSPGRVLTVLTAAALLAAVSPAAVPPTLAQTAPTEPTLPPAGPPAPASFAADLTRIYDEATAVPPPPGVTSTAPMSSDSFHQAVAALTPDQLTRMYNANPTVWPQVAATVDGYAQGVSSMAAKAAATPASRPPAAPGATPAAAAAAGGPPVIFTPTPCPDLAFAAQGGAYQQRYSLEVAQTGVELAAAVIETVAVGFKELEEFDIVLSVAAGEATLAVDKALELAAAVLESVADALEIPLDVIGFLLHRAIDSCQYDNGVAVVPATDANAVAAQTNVNASYDVGKQNLKLDQAINQLLDTRTQTIVNQLNGAQASLDQALRHGIEQALSGGNATSIVSYELPASLGGYLDATPIGVQVIVTSTMSTMQAAKQPISPSASKNLVLANNALAAGQYKQAFVYYQTTYGLLVR